MIDQSFPPDQSICHNFHVSNSGSPITATTVVDQSTVTAMETTTTTTAAAATKEQQRKRRYGSMTTMISSTCKKTRIDNAIYDLS